MISLNATITGDASPLLATLMQRLGPAGRKEFHEGAATEVGILLRAHVMDYAKTHHKTADNIRGGPARRTEHLTKAAESVVADASADEGTVSITSPGFRRALGPLPIAPKTKQHLTIPVHAFAYGKTVGEMVRDGTKIFRPRGRDFLATTIKEGDENKLLVLFALKTSVVLKHEPEMLPPGNTMADAAKDGVIKVLAEVIRKRSAA
jgi:hypothetical protein